VLGTICLAVLMAILALILVLVSSAVGPGVSIVVCGSWLAILLGWLETARAAMVCHGEPSASRALDRAIYLTARPRPLLVWLVLALPGLGLLALTVGRPMDGDVLGPFGTVIVGQAVAFLGAWMKVIRLAVAWRIATERGAIDRSTAPRQEIVTPPGRIGGA
jgi:hypothetical protein